MRPIRTAVTVAFRSIRPPSPESPGATALQDRGIMPRCEAMPATTLSDSPTRSLAPPVSISKLLVRGAVGPARWEELFDGDRFAPDRDQRLFRASKRDCFLPYRRPHYTTRPG